MKTRKIAYRLGSLEWIMIPTDWHKVEGIKCKRIETNMGLATRDYSKKCELGSEPLMVVEGFWIWWCKTHNQPYDRCLHEKLSQKLGKIIEGLNQLGFELKVKA